jgi:hypothetical protein
MVKVKDRKLGGIYTDWSGTLLICVNPDMGDTDGLFIEISYPQFSYQVDSDLWRSVYPLMWLFGRGSPFIEIQKTKRDLLKAVFKAQRVIQRYK